MRKKLLTIDDLVKFASSAKLHTFSSKEYGYQLAVQVPTTFEVEDSTDDTHRGMTKVKIKIFHEGLNANKSYLSHEAALEFAGTVPDRPVLAAIWRNEDGVFDFAGHELEYNDDGTVEYIEKQIGAFSSSPVFWEYDSEQDKNFACAYAYIPDDYTHAVDILKRKSGTKNSCELIIEEMSYNIDDDYLDLVHGYLSGTTFLGTDPDTGEEIDEGMIGSRADIVEFSVDKNSVNADIVEDHSAFIKNEEGGSPAMNEFDENQKIIDDETPVEVEPVEEPVEEPEVEAEADIEEETDEESEAEAESDSADGDGDSDGDATFSIVYELSHDDIRGQIWDALHTRTVDSDYAHYYWVCSVYDDYVVYQDEEENKFYRESYTRDDSTITLGGNAVEVYTEWLTAEEKGALELMRSTYDELKQYKDDAEAAELHAQKEAVLNSDDYSVLADSEEFAQLVENMDQYSVDELQNKADVLFAKHIKTVGQYARKNSDNDNVIRFNVNNKAKTVSDSPYPGLFEN